MNVNKNVINIYNRNRDDIIEKQRELYIKKQFYLEKGITINKTYYEYFINKLNDFYNFIFQIVQFGWC